MLLLLGTTVTASFFDSLNPSAIAQQMMLQAMVKRKFHIWFFIGGIALANLCLGLAVYYGIAAWLSQLLAHMTSTYPLYAYGGELAAGLLLLTVGICLLRRARNAAGRPEENGSRAPVHLSPPSLFAMGAAFCAVELTSALPYFGFLAVLGGYQLPFPAVLCFIALYSFIYALPLILLYLGYNRLQGTALIRRLERALGRVSAYVVPSVVSLASVLLVCHGAASLL